MDAKCPGAECWFTYLHREFRSIFRKNALLATVELGPVALETGIWSRRRKGRILSVRIYNGLKVVRCGDVAVALLVRWNPSYARLGCWSIDDV